MPVVNAHLSESFQEEIGSAPIPSCHAEMLEGEGLEGKIPIDATPELQPGTSARALIDIFALKTSLVTVIPCSEDGELHVEDVVEERELRALFSKAIMWFLEKESIRFEGAYIVFVGLEHSEESRNTHPALPVEALWSLAAELPLEDLADYAVVDDFDSFMFHAAKYLPRGYGRDPWASSIIVFALLAPLVAGLYLYLPQLVWSLRV